jgi:hypothetical protein
MESSMSKTGLDNRHRNRDGEISGKHGNTLVRTMGEIFVADVAPGEARRAPQLDVFNQVLRDRHSDLYYDEMLGSNIKRGWYRRTFVH